MNRRAKTRAIVLISGGGTNLQAFIDAVAAEELDIELVAVISNRADARGLERARQANIAAICIPSKGISDRAAYDALLAAEISRHSPDLVILAGFLRILGKSFVEQFAGRILNIHPSLLPHYPGLDTHERALAAGDKVHGCTVHFVTEELDGGPAILQGEVPVLEDDDVHSLAARVLAIEHRIYPQAVAMFAAGRIACRNGKCIVDGQALREPLKFSG